MSLVLGERNEPEFSEGSGRINARIDRVEWARLVRTEERCCEWAYYAMTA